MAIDLYNENTAEDNGGVANPPAPEVAPAPEPAPVPDPVVAEQVVYTKPIQATQWAAQAGWGAGMSIPTSVIAAYIRHLGYTTTASVDADVDTGIVTIVTTGSILTDSLWAGFAGGSGAAKVERTVAWTAFAESATSPVPTLPVVNGLWFYLERQGIGPVTIFRRYDSASYWLVLTTSGAIPAGVAEAYVYRAPASLDITRIQAVSRNNPPRAEEPFYVAATGAEVFQITTGVDLAGLQTVSDIVPVATETAQAPAQVQEQRQLDIEVRPGFFVQTTAPVDPREGDYWQNLSGTETKRRQGGAWVTVPNTQPTNEGSTGVGRFVSLLAEFATVMGWRARGEGYGATGVGAYVEAVGDFVTALGSSAKALAESAVAIGRGATVPVTSPRSIAIGRNAIVAENTPNRAVIRANELELQRSEFAGTGLFMASIIPGADATTDGGYLMGQGIPSGVFTEVGGKILSFGINVPQVGVRDSTKPGGLFRLDARAGVAGGGEFVVYSYAAGSNAAVPLIRIGLSDGRVRLAPSAGNVAIGQSGFGTAKLQIGAASGGEAPIKLTPGPLVSPPQTGAIEYSGDEFYVTRGASIRGRIATEAEVDAKISTAAAPVGAVQSGRLLSFRNTHNVGTLTRVTLEATRGYYVPFWVPRTVTVDAVVFYAWAISTGSLNRVDVGIYDASDTFLPLTRLASIVNFPIGNGAGVTAGIKTVSIGTVTLTGGRWYFAYIWGADTIDISGVTVAHQVPSLRGGLDTNMVPYLICNQAVGFNPPPVTAGAGSGPAHWYLDLAARVA